MVGESDMTNTKRFVSHVRNHLKQYGFTLVLSRGNQVNVDGTRCEGYFVATPDREIRVARGNPCWLDVLAHEYCHFLQWLETPQNILNSEDIAGLIVHNVSIGNRPNRYSSVKINNAFLKISQMERDCEIRTVKIIKSWNLPINMDLYIRRANLYIYLHHMWKEYGTRKTTFNPNSSRRILAKMPNSFKAKTHLRIPRLIESELSRCFE